MTGRGLPFRIQRPDPSAQRDDNQQRPNESIEAASVKGTSASSAVGSSTSFLDTAMRGRGVFRSNLAAAVPSAPSSMISVGRGRSSFAVRVVDPSPQPSTSQGSGSGRAGSSGVKIPSFRDASSSGVSAGRGVSASPLNASSGSREQATTPLYSASSNAQVEVAAPSEPDAAPAHARGVKGIPFQAITNCIRVNCQPGCGVFEYEVRFRPEVDSSELRSQYIRQHAEILGPARTFDGQSLLFLPKRLAEDITRVTSVGHDESVVNLEIIFKRQQRMDECMQLYNILFERVYKELNYLRVGRKNFDPTAPQVIKQHKLELWPGYVKAVEQLEGGIMLTLDVSHRVLATAPVLELMTDAYHSNASMFKENVNKALIGKMVMTRYNNRTYRVDDVLFDANPTQTFQYGNETISFVDYYKKHYNLEIRDKRQPLLLSRNEVRVSGEREKREQTLSLIPELCYLTGLTDKMRNNFNVMKDVATYTRVTPVQRFFAYKKFIANVENTPAAKAILSAWGLSLESNPLEVTARLLDSEKIVFGRRGETDTGEKGDFSRFATSNEVLCPIDIINWLLVYVSINKQEANSFESMLKKISAPTGISVSNSRRIELANDKTETFVNEIRKALSDTKIQIVVIIFPSQREDRYAAIKRTLCVEIPVPSQVIQAKTLKNETKNRSIVQKIILQMNAKLGGTLWSVKIPLKQTMICGIDTSHIAGSNPITVGAFVGSINPEFTRWFSKPTIQTKREELVAGLTASMEQCLQKYKEFNNALPERIILYRDGVGNGQLPLVKSFEIAQFKDAFKRIDSTYKPKLTFIVVQKRINTKFFAMPDPRDPAKMINPKPGSILDHTVTSLYLYDFFMIAQHVNQGTTTPSHYIIMEDESHFDADIIQRLTYKLTFLYYNWPGAVRVPAPCQYAHKLADLVGESIKRQTDEKLADKLFFL